MRWLTLLLLSVLPLRAAELTLRIQARWNGAALAVPSSAVMNDAGQELRFTRVAGVVSGVCLVRSDGAVVGLDGQYGAFDVEHGALALTLRNVPVGDYNGLELNLSLPAAVNHADVSQWPSRHPLNPLVNGLHWSWQGGFVFVAIEGRWRAPAGEERGFLYHLGGDAQMMTLRFSADFRVEGASAVELALDLGRVMGAHRLAADDGSESTHSGAGDELAPMLAGKMQRAWFWLEASSGRTSDAKESSRGRSRDEASAAHGATPLAFEAPRGFPKPELPADNPLTVEGVAVGRALFHDVRLSGNGQQSCASCHAMERAFTDGRARSVGASGGQGRRNSMPLSNLAWSSAYAWDGSQAQVRAQSLAAMRNPAEMNADGAAVIAALRRDAAVVAGFSAAFGDAEVTEERIGLALEQFVLTLVDADSRFDRALRGEGSLTEEEKRGFELFLTEYDPVRGRFGADCFHCHGGALLTDLTFKNNGLDGVAADPGRGGVSGRALDHGKFKTPSLRNVALTAPYMHDGRFETLEAVVAHYDHGVQRSASLDANLAKHPSTGLQLTAADQRALVAFLRALTDARYSSPSQ